jgi:hypothetical protein
MFGVAMIGYGIPINEFSFGNTLIVAGTTAFVGGLIVLAIGVAVAQLQRISEMLAGRGLLRPGRPLDAFEPAAPAQSAAPAARIPFPPKPKFEMRESHPYEPRMAPPPAHMPFDERAAAPAAPVMRNPEPVMRNPEMTPVEEYDEVSLSPGHADLGEPARPAPPTSGNGARMPQGRQEAGFESGMRSPPSPPPRRGQPQTNNFDTMWPTEPKPERTLPVAESRPEARPNPPPPTAAPPRTAGEPRSVAILKSGVVDGMGYTLYVDGSIEAELPQGTLRFASINELRNHLSKSA